MANFIKMVEVLALINDYVDGQTVRAFSIGYVKTNGSKGFKRSVRKAGGIYKEKSAGERSSFGYSLKEKAILLLQNMENDQTFSVRIHLLTHFNGIRIKH